MSELLDQQIDLLLENIAAGTVIPVIGADLLRVSYEDKELPLYTYIAIKLAQRLHIPDLSGLTDPPNLNTVFCEYLKQPRAWHGNGRPVPEDVYSFIPQILRESPLPIPERFQDLAKIQNFNIFITLTFDSTLADAINRVRFDNAKNTAELKYGQIPQDLPQQIHPEHPVVYYLFGKMSGLAYEYVVSDEDMLEFVHLLQRPLPINLFSTLKDNNLLFLGCTLSDWLARFLLRIAYERRLSQGGRRGRDILVNTDSDSAGSFRSFLDTFSPSTQLISQSPSDFVTALISRYRSQGADIAPPSINRGFADIDEGLVFLSYAHEDYQAVRRLRDFLVANNIKVWFDEEKNELGDDWKRQQFRNIDSCAYFVPICSKTSADRLEGEYRGEWARAIQRAHNRHGSLPLILPISIDDTSHARKGIPDEFEAQHWMSLPNGVGNDRFAAIMKKRMQEYARNRRHA